MKESSQVKLPNLLLAKPLKPPEFQSIKTSPLNMAFIVGISPLYRFKQRFQFVPHLVVDGLILATDADRVD
jgi:hypothetical protein